MTTTATTENAAYTAAISALAEIARAGSTEGVDGRRLAGLRRRGWLADDGRITAAGLDMLPTEARRRVTPAPKPKTAKAARCADCDVLLTSRTRGDVETLCSYCTEAAGMENEHADGYAEVGDHATGCTECGTYDAGAHWDATPARPQASRSTGRKGQPRPCGCGCKSMTSGGLWMPGHDARWAGQTGRAIAAAAPITADAEWLRADIAKTAPAGASAALIDKAARVALNAIAKAAAKRSA